MTNNVIQLQPNNHWLGKFPFVPLTTEQINKYKGGGARNPPGSLLVAPDDETLETVLFGE
jgi:hypothetical protein